MTLEDASKSSAAEQTISRVLNELESELHELSMKIHGLCIVSKSCRTWSLKSEPSYADHPEIAFQERYFEALESLADFS